MANLGTVDVDVRKHVGELTVTIRAVGLKRTKARIWLAKHIFDFGAWVAGTELEMSLD